MGNIYQSLPYKDPLPDPPDPPEECKRCGDTTSIVHEVDVKGYTYWLCDDCKLVYLKRQ